MAKKAAPTPKSKDAVGEKYDHVAVETAIKKIEAAYRLGKWSLDEHGESLYSKPNGIISAFAAEKGYRRDIIERARQFALAFTPKDVKGICRECREQNCPLGVSLIYRALAIGDTDKSMPLLQKAIKGHWTQRRMVAEIRKRPGAITHSGRPRVLPKNSTEARQAIVSRFRPGIGWLNELIKSKLGGKLDANLKGKIDAAVTSLESLVEAAS